MPDPLGVVPRRDPIEVRPPRAFHETATWRLTEPCVDPCTLAGPVVPGLLRGIYCATNQGPKLDTTRNVLRLALD
eukprot:5197257-Pyramimonas_sp.AAC.1